MKRLISICVLVSLIADAHSAWSSNFSFLRDAPKNCTESKGGSSHLIHLATHEGLASHYRQLENLWIVSQTVLSNVTIIEVPFRTHHFGDVTDVSMCEIFEFPAEVQCSCASYHEVGAEQTDCAILNYFGYDWASRPEYFGLNTSNSHVVKKDLDLSKTTCIAGLIHNLKFMTHYDSVLEKNPKNLHFKVQFTDRYLQLARVVREMMNLGEGVQFAAAHWRRGDQLTSRCAGTISGQHDQSVNCGSSESFIKQVQSSCNAQNLNHTVPVFVATNEVKQAELQQLHMAGYLTAANITAALGTQLTLGVQDLFVLEVVLMCQAAHFFHWGLSGINSIVEDCRKARQII